MRCRSARRSRSASGKRSTATSSSVVRSHSSGARRRPRSPAGPASAPVASCPRAGCRAAAAPARARRRGPRELVDDAAQERAIAGGERGRALRLQQPGRVIQLECERRELAGERGERVVYRAQTGGRFGRTERLARHGLRALPQRDRQLPRAVRTGRHVRCRRDDRRVPRGEEGGHRELPLERLQLDAAKRARADLRHDAGRREVHHRVVRVAQDPRAVRREAARPADAERGVHRALPAL